MITLHAANEWRERIEHGALDRTLETLYGAERKADAQRRYLSLLTKFAEIHGASRSICFVSAPGRTELGGNHTDHNHGRVLAGSVHLDSLAVVSPRDDRTVSLRSTGYAEPFLVDLRTLFPAENERLSTAALVRGVAAGFENRGLRTGGFDAYLQSDVLPGSGLSSSASVEVLLGTILNELFNEGDADAVRIAQIGQFAENTFFGKPCGLMDQTACAHGGIVAIDFRNPQEPEIDPVSYSFEDAGFRLVVIDTGGDHADLTPDYAAVPAEMKAAAAALGAGVLRDADRGDLLTAVARLRRDSGDRSILRALHFFGDNDRVPHQVDALRRGDIGSYLDHVRRSGDSSWMLLQNCYTVTRPGEQGITLAIALTRELLDRHGHQGAARVHGGGFAGTIQAYIPLPFEQEYRAYMQTVFGQGCVTSLSIRNAGAVAITDRARGQS